MTSDYDLMLLNGLPVGQCNWRAAESVQKIVEALDKLAPQRSALPYRDRAEVYAIKDGKVFGSLYEKGNFGVFGGGVEEGEDGAEAAAREFMEETGHDVSNVRPLPFGPYLHEWRPPYSDPKQAERAKKYRGSRTHFFVADLGEEKEDATLDKSGPKRKAYGLYTFDDAIAKSEKAVPGDQFAEANKLRAQILEHLKNPTEEEKAADDFAARNEAARLVAKKSKLIHIQEGYIPCECGKRYFVQPDDDKCPACGHTLTTRLRGKKSSDAEYDPVMYLVKRADDDDRPFTIAVDLDGTLAETEEPFDAESIGPPRDEAIRYVKLFRKAGARIIIWTVRGDKTQIGEWLDENGVPYDYINENPDQPDGSSGKIIADVYWDDRGYNAQDPHQHALAIFRKISERDNKDAPDEPDGAIVIQRTMIRITGSNILDAAEEDDV